VARGRRESRAWRRSAAATLTGPARHSTPMARLRRQAMALGAAPVRTWEASSAKESSLRRYRSIEGMPMQSSLAYLGQEPNTAVLMPTCRPSPRANRRPAEPGTGRGSQPIHWARGWSSWPALGGELGADGHVNAGGVEGLDRSGAPAGQPQCGTRTHGCSNPDPRWPVHAAPSSTSSGRAHACLEELSWKGDKRK
jgi:hypothetical protein